MQGRKADSGSIGIGFGRIRSDSPVMRPTAKADTDVEQRMRVFTLIRDMTADAFGGWNLVTALQAGGGLKAQRIMMSRTFDMPRARTAALRAAGALKDD